MDRIFSKAEQSSGQQRPCQVYGHLPDDMQNPSRWPYMMALIGAVKNLPGGEHDSLSPVQWILVPQSVEEGTILSTEPYQTIGEAMAVGGAFPGHSLYSDWEEGERAMLQGQNTRPNNSNFPIIGRVALEVVCMYFSATRLEELRLHPDFEEHRLYNNPGEDGGSKLRYVFASRGGAKNPPLAEVVFEREIQPTDLQAPNYGAWRDLFDGVDPQQFSVDYFRAQLGILEIAGSVPRASEEELSLARTFAAHLSRANYPENLYPEGWARLQAEEQNRIMATIFEDSWAGE